MLFQFYDSNEGKEERRGSIFRLEVASIRRGRLSAPAMSGGSWGGREEVMSIRRRHGREYGAARRRELQVGVVMSGGIDRARTEAAFVGHG